MTADFEQEERKRARALFEKGLDKLSRRENAPKGTYETAYRDSMMELMALVLERNEVINLTTITEMEEFAKLHLLDSLACVGLPELEGARSIIDVGSGSGFPGLPLAAMYPEKQFLLIDSLRKRSEFVQEAAKRLGLENIRVLHARAETAGQDAALRESFELALCRAVGKLPIILEYCLPFVKVGGACCFYKTISSEREIKESLLARELLGGSAEVRVESYEELLPGRKHALYIIRKERHTPMAYPRREGIPEKVPL